MYKYAYVCVFQQDRFALDANDSNQMGLLCMAVLSASHVFASP